MRRLASALVLSALCAVPAAPAEADWDAQVSSRLLLGGGAYVLEQGEAPWPLFELGLRADVAIGEARPSTVRFGPALDLRTEDFRTFEIGGGAMVFFPTGLGFGITATAAAGWGARPEDRDGAFVLGQLAIGYRPYNYFSAYGYAVSLYAGARVQVEPAVRAWELTVGFEVDLEFPFAIPFMFLVELARGEDPHEPLEPDAAE